LKTRGLVSADSGRFTESFPVFRRQAELAYGKNAPGQQTPPHKAQHDQEQRDYLNGGQAGGAPLPFHLEEGASVSGRAVNPDRSQGAIAATSQSSSPQIAVIDNLLTD